MNKNTVNIKYLLLGVLLFIPAGINCQIKIFATDSINIEEWNYNQRKIIRAPEPCIIAESKNEIFFSYNLGDPVKIFDGKNASLAVDNNSKVHIVFEDAGIRYSSMSYPGDWQSSILISDSSETASSPIADCDKYGNVHIVYAVSDSVDENIYLTNLKYVKIYNNEVQISSAIYDMETETNPYTLVDYTIANHLLFIDETVFLAYQLSNDSIYIKYSRDNGTSWLTGGVFHGTSPRLSIGPGSHWSDPLIEDAVFPVLLYLDAEGDLTNYFADYFQTDIFWYGSEKMYDGPIESFSIDDVIGPFGYSYIFQKDGILYHAFSNIYNTVIMDTITENAIVSSIAYKHFDLNKVDIVWYEKNADSLELFYQWFQKLPSPVLKLTSDFSEAVCNGASDGFINIDVSGGNPPYNYYWSTGAVTKNISDLPPGNYSVIVTDQNSYEVSASFNISGITPYKDEEICMITVDTTTRKNLLLWQITPDKGIASYNVYRETASMGQYDLIGNIPYGLLSIFPDTVVNPDNRQYSYKISVVDSCGNESELSHYHKPMFLILTESQGEVNLEWTGYDVEDGDINFTGLEIWRGNKPSRLEKYVDIGTGISTYTDNSPEVLTEDFYYRVVGLLSETCYPFEKLKTVPFDFSRSGSNIVKSRALSVQDYKSPARINIWPNPFNESATLKFVNPAGLSYTLSVMDLSGKVCLIVNNIITSEYSLYKGDLKPGFYFIELIGPIIYRDKIIIE
jgi:hypothetical protein